MQNELNDALLSAYLDDQLTGEERAAVEARLRESAEHRQALAELQQLRESFQALPRFELGDDFASRVMAAAVAAEAQQDTANEPARMPIAPTPTPVEPAPTSRSFRRLAYVAGAVAAVAACLLVIVQMGGSPVVEPSAPIGPGTGEIASTEPEQPTELPAVAALRGALPEQGEALVVRVRVPAGTKPSDALNVALAQSGIRELAPSEPTPAGRVGAAYRKAIGAQGKPGVPATGPSASEALYIEAPLALVEDALAVLADQEGGQLELRPEMKVAVSDLPTTRAVGEGEAGEGEGGSQGEMPASQEPFAQRLTPRLFRFPQDATPAVESTAEADVPEVDPNRKVRVLILVETVK